MALRTIARQCVSCRSVIDRKSLLRILLEHKSGKYIIGPSNFDFGKSIYVCQNPNCIEGLKKNKRYKDKLDFIKISEKTKEKIQDEHIKWRKN